MLGVLESLSLDLNPAVSSTLDIITATRAGTATYTDASGNIQTASPNTVRVDHVQGEELTPTKFQRVKYTDFSSGWNNTNATSQAGDGYLGQPSLIVNAPVINARTTTSVPTETGVSYTASFYVRYVSGSSGLVWMYTQFASDNQFTPITVTSEWTRVQVQFTGGSGSVAKFGVSPKVAGESVEIAMPQVEEGTVATSFIPTSGSAVTRAADDLVIDGSDFTDFYNDAEGTIYVEYEPRVLSTSNTALEFSDGSANNRIFSLVFGAYHCYIIDGGVNQAVLDGGTNTAGVLNRLAFSYETNNIQASLEGGAVVSDTSASIPTVDRLMLGSQTVANTRHRHLNGRIKRLIYWPYHSDNI
jgi:hypothetical protein